MRSSIECLAKASELDALARNCPAGPTRDGYVEAAAGWRSIAILAREQEAWAGLYRFE